MAEPLSLTEYINRRLDADFNKSAGKILKQIQAILADPNGRLQKALIDLDVQVQRLEDLQMDMSKDDPAVERVLLIYAEILITVQTLIAANAEAIQTTSQLVAIPAVTAKVFIQIATDLVNAGKDPIASLIDFQSLLKQANIPWNIPDLTFFTDQAVTSFVDSVEWIARMEQWGKGYANLTRQTTLDGIMQGMNPREIARLLRLHAENIPQAAAENLMRTLQLTSYREASLAMEKINGQFILKKIRIASLDNRTCLACIALHGTELALGQRVDDHYRGRCSEYYVVPGGREHPDFMLADSPSGGRTLVPWQNGTDWFNSLSPARQQQQISFMKSPGKWNAFVAGTPLSDFVAEHMDDVFGNQIIENSLFGIFGEDASKYYARNNR